MATHPPKAPHPPPTNAPVNLPATGFLRLAQIVGNPKATPPIPPIFPISKSGLWAKVKNGTFPKPVKLGPRTTAWKVEDIRALIENIGTEGGQ